MQGAELELLYRALASPELVRDFTNTLVVRKPHYDHPALIGRKAIYKLEEPRALFDFFHIELFRSEFGCWKNFLLLGRPFGAIDYRIRSDPEEPGGERHTTPFKTRETCQRLVKDFGGYVLGIMAVADPPRDVCVNSGEVILVKLGKPGRVFLSCLDGEPLGYLWFLSLQSLFSGILPL